MKLLLTADLHLRSGQPERKEALERIITRCEEQDVDYLLIAGDMFDANVDVEDIKPEVRELFSDNDFQTFVIPGNHDRTAFREEDYFGDDIEILRKEPFTQRTIGNVNLVAVPYFESDFEDLVEDLADAQQDDLTNILLLHCTLAGAEGTAFGTESRYLPVKPEHLLQTQFDYVFAGHIHSSPTKRVIGNDTIFLYPGSPASVTKTETGQRGVWLLDTDTDQLTKLDLNTFHYDTIELDLSPGEADDQLDTLRTRLADKDLDNTHLIVNATGFIEKGETAFFNELQEIVTEANPAKHDIDRTEVKSVQSIIQTDLYQKFTDKLQERDDINQHQVERIALEAYSRHTRG